MRVYLKGPKKNSPPFPIFCMAAFLNALYYIEYIRRHNNALIFDGFYYGVYMRYLYYPPLSLNSIIVSHILE